MKKGVPPAKHRDGETRLGYYRKECGITQERLAEDTGISKSLIRHIESGDRKIEKMSYDKIQKLSKVLGVEIKDLLEREEGN